jgi:hypothetical protein
MVTRAVPGAVTSTATTLPCLSKNRLTRELSALGGRLRTTTRTLKEGSECCGRPSVWMVLLLIGKSTSAASSLSLITCQKKGYHHKLCVQFFDRIYGLLSFF